MMSGMIDKDRLKAHANRHITKILDALNIEYTERGPLFQGNCPIHDHPGNGDNSTAFSWKEEANGWVCWSHGCDDRWGGDVYGLVKGVLNISFKQSLEFVLDTLTNQSVDISSEVIQVSRNDSTRPHMHRTISETCLKFLEERYDYPIGSSLLDRGYDPWILREFEVGYWHQFGTFMNDRLVFPVRDHEGFLIGFTGRTVFPKDKWEKRGVKSKWIHGSHFIHWPTADFLISSVLYNLNRAKDSISDGSIILVEGPLDGIKLTQAGIHNWAAILGVNNFSPPHRTLLINAGVNTLKIAFDPDVAGQSATRRITELTEDFFHIEPISLPGKDPGDMTTDELKKVFL